MSEYNISLSNASSQTLKPTGDIEDDPPSDQAHTHAVAYQHKDNKIIQSWILEMIALGVSVGLVAAIFVILGHYDGHELPKWPYSINLNTLISVTSTIKQTLFTIVITAIVSQSKWLWYTRDHPLLHMDRIDQASRGTSGSLKLLFWGPRSTIATVGALLTLLSLLVGPFTQQAINTTPCPRTLTRDVSSVPIAHFAPGFSVPDPEVLTDVWVESLPLGVMATAVNGIVNPDTNNTVITAATFCSTGNCTFAPDSEGITHSTIALCHSCVDTTPLVTISSNGNFTLPNKQWVDIQSYRLLDASVNDLTWASSTFTDGFANLISWSLVNISMLTLTSAWCVDDSNATGCPANFTLQHDNRKNLTGVAATVCTIYPCLKNFRAKVRLGVLDETLVSTVPATGDWGLGGEVHQDLDPKQLASVYNADYQRLNYTAVREPCRVDNSEYNISKFKDIRHDSGHPFVQVRTANNTTYDAPAECVFRMDAFYGSKIASFIETNLFAPGGVCFGGSPSANDWWNTSLTCASPALVGTLNANWWLTALWASGVANPQSLISIMDGFSITMTNYLRTTGGRLIDYGNIPRDWANGTVQEMTVCNVFEWEWLLMPLLVVVIGVALLMAVIIDNRRYRNQQVWKDSLLPLLLYHNSLSTQPDSDPTGFPTMDLEALETLTKRITRRFQNGNKAGFVSSEAVGNDSSIELPDLEFRSLIEHPIQED